MDTNLFPTAVDVTLYKYNHHDNRLWTRIINDLEYIQVDNDSIMVSMQQLYLLLDNYYINEINKVRSVGAEFLHKKVTTPYFVYMMCTDMPNLQYVKFTKSYDKSFSRIIEIEGDKILKFDFKVLSMTINLYNLFTPGDLKIINPVLESINVLEEDTPYARLKLVDLLDSLDLWINNTMDDEIEEGQSDPIPLVTTFIDIIDPKTERDNPLVLLVTDY